jgi:hypothetical protein
LAEQGLSPRKIHSIVDCSSQNRGSVQVVRERAPASKAPESFLTILSLEAIPNPMKTFDFCTDRA